MLNATLKKKSLNNFSAGLGQADVTQPGSIKSPGVHISLTNSLFSCAPGILGFSFAVDMVYLRRVRFSLFEPGMKCGKITYLQCTYWEVKGSLSALIALPTVFH